MKYVRKNCPACYQYDSKYGCEDNHDEQGRDTYCDKISDCVMKNIVEKCKEHHTETFANFILSDILALLDIEEVE